MPHLKVIRDSVAALQCPKYSDSAWIPVFEQLAGAGYALLEAERHGYTRRDQRKHQYHTHVRENVAAWIVDSPFRQDAAERALFEDWLAGFYFNSAMHRLVASADRLLEAVAELDCGCGRHKHAASTASHAQLWTEAHKSADHAVSAHKAQFTAVKELLAQCPPDRHRREMEFDPAHGLAMMRFELSHRQHFAHAAKAHATNGDAITWSAAAPILQMTCAAETLALLSRAYNELSAWQPAVREECAALGATA